MKLCVSVYLSLVSVFSITHFSNCVLPYEPIQYLTAQLPINSSSPLTDFLQEATPLEAGSWTSKIKENLRSYLANTGTSVFFARGERVLAQYRAKKFKWDSSIEIPYTNLMSIVSIALPILFENFEPDVLSVPVGHVLKGNDNKALSLSFLDLVNKLPETRSPDLTQPSTLSDLENNGKVAFDFLNTLLESNAKEAWLDALMAIGSHSLPPTEDKQLVMDMEDILQLSLTVSHDSTTMDSPPNSKTLPLDDNKFLFGWWFNCPKDSTDNCLIPNAPADTIFTISPELRMYVTPSLELTVIVVGPEASSVTRGGSFKESKKLESIGDILREDNEIWKLFDPSVVSDSSVRESHD